ncbi:hypothetical protein [Nonomuraea salmonea]|uniref:hypothetical protein n=1 Tax=Nonomuraea salmonea TaxID=46181 RepID=UPI0031EA8401
MAAGVVRDDPVAVGERRDLVVPHRVVEEAAVQQDDGLAGAVLGPEQILHDNQGVMLARE